MSDEKPNGNGNGIFRQVAVFAICGILSGVLSGSMTARILVEGTRQELELHKTEFSAHVTANNSVEAQVRRDISRGEATDARHERDMTEISQTLQQIQIQLAVLVEKSHKEQARVN